MKILTANIAMGNPYADRLRPNLRGLMWFHNWRVIPYLIFGGRFGTVFDYGSYTRPGRVEYLKEHSSLRKVIDLIVAERPDVLVLNEVLRQVHYEDLSVALQKLGYCDVVWSWSPHHPDATLGTMIASKLPLRDAASLDFPWGRQIGGGGGAAYARLEDAPLTVIGCHLVIGKMMRSLFEDEIEALVEFASGEQRSGRQVVIAGDFNAGENRIQKTSGFASLHLKTVTTRNTNPTCLPEIFRTACDHIFVASDASVRPTHFVHFGSDHLAVMTEVRIDGLN